MLGVLWTRTRLQPLTSYDQPFYLGIAHDMLDTHRFTDGVMFADPTPDGVRPSGMRFMPLYPTLLAAAAWLAPSFHAALDCAVAHGPLAPPDACPRAAPLVRGVQFAMLAAVYLMLWWAAGVVAGGVVAGGVAAGGVAAGGVRAAWIGLGIGLAVAPFLLLSVNYLMTETTSLFLATAATAAALAAWRAGRPWRWVALAGVLLGLLALTRPAFFYLFLATAAAGLIAVTVGWPGPRRRAAALLVAFSLGVAAPVGPWIARNAIVLGRPALTHGYDSHTLVQRLSFDSMPWHEYPMAFICWLPDGPGLGAMIGGRGACDHFGWDDKPESYFEVGNHALLTETLQAAGGWDNHLHYLLTHFVLADPVKYVLVTIPLALRGAWIDHYWGLVLGLVCFGLTIGALRRRDGPFLTVALPAWFMLAFNAAVAVNQPRYNLMLVMPYAIAGAILVERRLIARNRATMPAGLVQPVVLR